MPSSQLNEALIILSASRTRLRSCSASWRKHWKNSSSCEKPKNFEKRLSNFTGAMQDFPGMIAAADSGTLFLDEISDMPAELQTRFLRVLQEREYRPLGSTQTLKADFRAIASSNRPVAQALSENRLRSDLYYR